MSAKRGFWSVVGKILWAIISFVFKIAAKLGSTWARKRLDQHNAKKSAGPVSRVLHRHDKN